RPTVRGMAAEVEEGLRGGGVEVGAADEIEAVERGGELPLSFAQQRLWLAEQLEVSSPLYNVPAAIRLTGALDADALEQSLNEIVRRHEALRTSFATVKGRPVQVVVPAQGLKIPKIDLSGLGKAEREAEALSLARKEAQRPFDLSQPQLLRVTLVRLAEDEHVVLLTMHHIVSDGWSLGVLVREVGALYESYSHNLPVTLPELPIQYADFAVWQRAWLEGAAGARQLAYWKKQLAGAPDMLPLPTDYPRPPAQSFRGTVETFTLAPALRDTLKAFSLKEGATLFMTLLSAFDALLYLYTKQETILVGTDIANRNRGELEKLIGFFVNQLVLRADMSGNPTFRELLRRVTEVSLGAYAHQDMPFDKLVEELNPKRDLNRPVLFQVKMVFQNAPIPPLKLSRLELAPLEIAPQTAKYDLLLEVGEAEEGLRGAMHYRTELFDAKTIARMLKHYEAILRHASGNADVHLHELEEVLRVADEQERATEEKDYAQARLSKLKNIKRRVVV
ncbi:MAG TPA: condensation domain-containing protein, partial [Pyrinomonadaceae bacterium]|nr:condensation domain-containing protein [Pyrinomonadaceae bacterium]